MRTFRGGLLIGLAVAVAVAAVAVAYELYDTRTLKRTIRRGEVLCGVNKGLPGFSIPDDKGNWTGFDVDFCRAVAAAIFDDPKKAKFIPLDANERFKELQNRKVDILSRNSTWSMSREENYDLYFPAVAYYDGQGFMLPRARKIDSALELNDSKVCVQEGTTTQLNLADYFRANNMKYEEMKFAKLDDVIKAYESGKCDTFTADVSAALCAAAELRETGRPRHPARRHLQGAARARRAPARRRLDDDREVDAVCDDQCRGTRRHLEEHRRGAEIEEAGRDAAGRHRRHLRRGSRADQGLGRRASSGTSAITARSTSATSAADRSCTFRAGSTSSGAPAASSTPRRSGDGL